MATESRTLIYLALIANGVIAVIKFIAAAISGSSAMLSEGFHRIEEAIQEELPEATRIFIELEPGL